MRSNEQRLLHFLETIRLIEYCSLDFVQRLCGFTQYEAESARNLAIKLGYAETFRIPSSETGRQNPPKRYGITKEGVMALQRGEKSGAHDQPKLARPDHRMISLTASNHLDWAREKMLSLRGQGLIWGISPWRFSSTSWADVLFLIRNQTGGYVLMALALPPFTAAAPYWYTETVYQWKKWLEGHKKLPIIFGLGGSPRGNQSIQHSLRTRRRRYAKKGGGDKTSQIFADLPERIFFFPNQEKSICEPLSWQVFDSDEPAGRLPWDTLAGLDQALSPEAFLAGTFPKCARPYNTLGEWAQASTNTRTQLLRDYDWLKQAHIRVLETLLQFPALTVDEISSLSGLNRRKTSSSIRELAVQELVEIPDQPLFKEERFVLADRGEEHLAYRYMLTPNVFRKHRGWANDYGHVYNHPQHMQAILRFMFSLQEKGHLTTWRLQQARFSYLIPSRQCQWNGKRWISIRPDSSGTIRFGDQDIPFWLEIDRGTRGGSRLNHQLLKYLLIRQAISGTDEIPLLFYVIQMADPVQEDKRADLIRRKFLKLTYLLFGRGHPSLPAIFITTWHRLSESGDSKLNIMCPVWQSPYSRNTALWPIILPDASRGAA